MCDACGEKFRRAKDYAALADDICFDCWGRALTHGASVMELYVHPTIGRKQYRFAAKVMLMEGAHPVFVVIDLANVRSVIGAAEFYANLS